MMNTNAAFCRYLLRAYGQPRIADEEYDNEREAIDSGRRHATSEGHHFAEVRDRMNAKIVWSGYINQAGEMKETYEREPGSDDV
jgi:hypothetical protein